MSALAGLSVGYVEACEGGVEIGEEDCEELEDECEHGYGMYFSWVGGRGLACVISDRRRGGLRFGV